jgi:hypothetical protein
MDNANTIRSKCTNNNELTKAMQQIDAKRKKCTDCQYKIENDVCDDKVNVKNIHNIHSRCIGDKLNKALKDLNMRRKNCDKSDLA